MRIAALTIRLYAPWVHSLKEKRTVVKSLVAKLQQKFKASAAEVDEQDTLQVIVIGVASIAADAAQADSIIDHILDFIEQSTEAQITQVLRELR